MSLISTLRDLAPAVVVAAYENAGSIEGAGRILGISTKSKHTRDAIKRIIHDHDPKLLRVLSTRNNYTVDQIKIAVANSVCMSDVLRALQLTTHGANAAVIKRLMNEHNIDSSHFTGSGSNKHRWNTEDIFVQNSPLPRASVHAQVVRRGVLGPMVCKECGIADVYNGKPIKLTVDHINGISDDNRIENLRWLCPNCHSQTETYGGKAVKLRVTKDKPDDYI